MYIPLTKMQEAYKIADALNFYGIKYFFLVCICFCTCNLYNIKS